MGLVVGNAGLGPEELCIDGRSGQAGSPLTEDAHHGGVQVGVAAEDAEDHRVVGIELVLGERTDPRIGVTPPQFGHADPVGVAEGEVERTHGHRVGEHLADVGPRPERVAL